MTDPNVYLRWRNRDADRIETIVAEVDSRKHDPFDVLEFARARLHPDVTPPAVDESFDAVMLARELRCAGYSCRSERCKATRQCQDKDFSTAAKAA